MTSHGADLLRLLMRLVAWTDAAVSDGAPSLPERLPLWRAAWDILKRSRGQLPDREAARLETQVRAWKRELRAVSVDLAHPWSQDAVTAGEALAALDAILEGLRKGQEARRAKGKPVDTAKLAELEHLHEALVAYDTALHRAMGYERATRQATYYADKLHERVTGGAA